MLRRKVAGLLGVVAAVTLTAGEPGDFNGVWNIRAPGSARLVSLHIQGAGTGNARGYLLLAGDGGGTKAFKDLPLAISGGQLSFRLDRRHPTLPAPDEVHTAKLLAGRLEGRCEFVSSSQPPLNWAGTRAPEIKDADDGSWTVAAPIELFNGRDLTGWRAVKPDKPLGWEIQDGVLVKPDAKAGDIATHRTFWNFQLHIEHRLLDHRVSNSGAGLRGRYELQIFADFGVRPSDGAHGAVYGHLAPAVNASKPVGEWQSLDARLVGRQATVWVNGVKVIDRGVIPGVTLVTLDLDEDKPGPITLQGDHRGRVEFRKLAITPLVSKQASKKE